jgi:hypothetical protein
MEMNTYSVGVHLLDTNALSMNNLLLNNVATGIQLDNCAGISIYGWHSEGITTKGLHAAGCSGITIEGFYFSYMDNTTRFYLTDGTMGVKIRNGTLRGSGGFDLHTTDTTRNVEFDNVRLFDAEGTTVRGPLMNTVPTAHGKYAGTTTDLKGLPFIQLKASDNTTTLFEVGSTGTLTLPSGIRILTGNGSPLNRVSAPTGSLYLRTDGGVKTTLYVKESGTGSAGWIGK